MKSTHLGWYIESQPCASIKYVLQLSLSVDTLHTLFVQVGGETIEIGSYYRAPDAQRVAEDDYKNRTSTDNHASKE